MTDIKSLTLEELQAELANLGVKPYRAQQTFAWLHKHMVQDFAAMTNLPLSLRETLAERYRLPTFSLEKVVPSSSGDTHKYLFALPDGERVESVLLKYRHGHSVCLSSQIGCRMGCAFCASALGGLKRSLTAGEMLEQVYAIKRRSGETVSHAVVMGMGEPLDNYDELLRFVQILSHKDGQNISQRHITVSTCGLVPAIRRLADEKLAINLAVSLHAASDEKRRALMPIAKTYPLAELIEACRYYFGETGRRLTFEYSLIDGFNDAPADALALCGLLDSLNDARAHVNLIPLNPVAERGYAPSAMEKIADFKNTLEKKRKNVTIRREMGSDINGACGQLRRSSVKPAGDADA
jgi:23S rRNA (adenine2503-C2)-methyltransferase